MIQIEATARGRPVEEGGYLWRGELRLWDNEILMGWYAASDGSVRSKGTMYFVMHPHGISVRGRWVGLSDDGTIITGWSGMAKTEAEARELVGELKERRLGWWLVPAVLVASCTTSNANERPPSDRTDVWFMQYMVPTCCKT